MTRCLLRSALFGSLLLFCLGSVAHAQQYRTDDGSFYFNGRIGINFYGGDRDVNPDNEISKYIDNIGGSFGLELGYHFNDRFTLGLMHVSGLYPKLDANRFSPPAFPVLDPDNSSEWAHHLNAILRVQATPKKRVSPYGQIGANFSFGKLNGETQTGIGPTLGFGIDVAVSNKTGIFLELDGIFTFPDDGLDLADPGAFGSRDDVSDFDAFTFLGLGIRHTFKPAFVPVDVLSIDCPANQPLQTGQTGNFTATINQDATQPVEVRWDFGDGGTAAGLSTSHAFTGEGTYTVTVTANNANSSDSATCTVRIIAPAEIVTITPSATSVDVCDPGTPVVFSSNVRGTRSISYRWDFGDGSSSNEANPSHIYRTAGTYTVTLTLTNEGGTDTRTLIVTVDTCFCEEVTDLNSAFFDRNSSVLTPEGRQALQENLDILLQCDDICARIEGYASRDERNPQQLSADRARAVQQFYVDGGLDIGRTVAVGLGAQGQTTIKSGTAQFRRVDSIPQPCTSLDRSGANNDGANN